MKPLVLAAAMTLAIGTACSADGLHWVVANRAANQCEIVTSTPIVAGDIWFEDGPYRSLDDAKIAPSTIRVCPKDDPPAKNQP